MKTILLSALVSMALWTSGCQVVNEEPGRLIPSTDEPSRSAALPTEGSSSSETQFTKLDTGSRCTPPETTYLRLFANLNSDDAPPAAAWDPQNAAATSNCSTSFTAYNRKGERVDLSVYFVKTSDQNWDYHVVYGGDAPAFQATEVLTGSLQFDGAGTLLENTITGGGNCPLPPQSDEAAQRLTLQFGGIVGVGEEAGSITSFADPDSFTCLKADGHPIFEFCS
jgi:flagellar hook protein FlgE